jgi:glycosyltransferase involved in cell wall biosynthesis
LALRSGGYVESIVEGVTGEFYEKNAPKDLMDGLISLLEKEENYNHYKIRKHAEKFSEENFENQLADFLDKVMK